MNHTPRSGWLALDHFPNDPERSLLAAVVVHAVRDYRHGRSAERHDAHAYFFGPNFEADAAWLGLDPGSVRRLLQEEHAQ